MASECWREARCLGDTESRTSFLSGKFVTCFLHKQISGHLTSSRARASLHPFEGSGRQLTVSDDVFTLTHPPAWSSFAPQLSPTTVPSWAHPRELHGPPLLPPPGSRTSLLWSCPASPGQAAKPRYSFSVSCVTADVLLKHIFWLIKYYVKSLLLEGKKAHLFVE